MYGNDNGTAIPVLETSATTSMDWQSENTDI